jgi:hypothetical protein
MHGWDELKDRWDNSSDNGVKKENKIMDKAIS